MLERLIPRNLRSLPEPELLALWREQQSSRARELLVKRYQGLVHSIAGKFRPKPHDFADYVQAGNLGLIAAIDNAEVAKLSSYASPAIYREIRDYKNTLRALCIARPDQDSFKYRWASPGARVMLLASEG